MMFRLQQFAAAIALVIQSTLADSIDDATSARDAHGSCAPGTSASLLQKAVKHDMKSTLTQEQWPRAEGYGSVDAAPQVQQDKVDNLYDTVCTGTQAQGRCWFLSDVGETCSSTCERHGRVFSFVIADGNNPVTPKLVEHEPKIKQEPWAVLECYVPSEDRYHTANENAARHFVNDIGDWSQETCKLACPCGGTETDRCSWKAPQACAPEFMFKGVKYSGCATVDLEHERPWCQHNYQHTDKNDDALMLDWSYCTYSCIPEEPVKPKTDQCIWTPADSCVKEYDYEGTHYVGCTSTDHDNPWCSNADPYQGSWNHCTYSCANQPENKDPVVRPVPSVQKLCTWQPKATSLCEQAFEYKGVQYTGCITQDYPTPWCSLDRVHKGTWETCERVCSSATVPVAPVPAVPQPVEAPWFPKPDPNNAVRRTPAYYPAPDAVPRTPISRGEPCDSSPLENDIIGKSVTLDEAGYKIASNSDSTVNMKRFVCRVAGSIGCRVMDLPALEAFLPYYGRASDQTYKRLEAELTTLCRSSTKWVMPQPLPAGWSP